MTKYEKLRKMARKYVMRVAYNRRMPLGAGFWVLMGITAALMLVLSHPAQISLSNLSGLTALMAVPRLQTIRKCAYVFYAANDGYGCGALVNMMRLRRLGEGLPPHVDLILIASDEVSPAIRRTAIEIVGAKIFDASNFPSQITPPLGKFSEYYRQSSNKFLAFQLPNTTYRRLVLMDADSLILRPPHHLLELPDEIPFAAPKAYWYWNNPQYQDTAFWTVPELRLSRQDFLTSWIMSIRPDPDTFLRLQKKNDELIAKRIPDVYDMDLFNVALGEEITALPPDYGMLDFEFMKNDNKHMTAMLDDIIHGVKGWAVHFSGKSSGGMGKPMIDWVDPANVPQIFPHAHPGYQILMQTWNDDARAVCPSGSYPEALST